MCGRASQQPFSVIRYPFSEGDYTLLAVHAAFLNRDQSFFFKRSQVPGSKTTRA